MTYRMPPEMAEATRLTRLGKLTEATALIQRFLRGGHAAEAAKNASPATIDAEYTLLDTEAQPSKPQSHQQKDHAHPHRPRTSLRLSVNRLAEIAKAFSREAGLAARPSPAPLPDGASFTTAAFANSAGKRDYKLYIPSTRTDQRMALIVMLHGCTQTPDDFAAGTRMNELAEEHGFLVAYPAQNASANLRQCWNWFKPEDQRRDQGEPSLIAGITQEIIRDHHVDPSRVFIAGLSAGGAAAMIMADVYADLYAAVGVHSGLPAGAASDLPSAFDAMRVGAAGQDRNSRIIPAIVFHGDEDSVVHPRNADAVVAQALGSSTGLRQTIEHGKAPGGHSYIRTVHADADGRAICEQWSIRGAGHAWAGGSSSGSHTDPCGPDASREMVRFFFEQRK